MAGVLSRQGRGSDDEGRPPTRPRGDALRECDIPVMRLFVENLGRVVTRDELLRDVWQQPFGGSNVVDAVIRTLRQKLGSEAGAVETVKGDGYRFRGFGRTGAALS